MELNKVSIRSIIPKIIMDLGLGDKEIPYLTIFEWVAWGLQQIGSYTQYIEKYNTEIEIESYRGNLPSDFYRVMENPKLIYKITGDMITTNIKEGIIKFNYLAFQVDEDGYPLIPDHPSFFEALMWLVAYRLAIRDELPNKKLDITFCKSRWDFYCKQARAKGQELDEDQKARFAKMFLGLSTSYNQYNQHYNKVDNNKRIADGTN